MPFIHPKERPKYDPLLEILIRRLKEETMFGSKNSGHVAYVLYKIIKQVYGYCGTFEEISNALKILDSVYETYVEDVLKPYEQEKKAENGDVE